MKSIIRAGRQWDKPGHDELVGGRLQLWHNSLPVRLHPHPYLAITGSTCGSRPKRISCSALPPEGTGNQLNIENIPPMEYTISDGSERRIH
jgi:hypothetical protein